MTVMWEARLFEDCIERVNYTTKLQRKEFLSSGTYPVVSQEEEFINGYWNNETDVLRLDRPAVIFGDHTRILKYVDFDFVLGADGVKVLKPKPFLYPRFFYYQLHTARLVSLGYARHYRLLKEFEVSFPDIHEQQRIVVLLDKAFAGIAKARANAEQNLRNARELLDSYLQSVFSQRGDGWRERAVSEISDHTLGKMLDKAKNRGELQPYLRNLNVRWFGFDLDDLSVMRFTGDEKHRYSIIRGDVVICEGGYPGRAAIWDKDESIYFQKALHRVRFHNKRHNKWFLYYLFSQHSCGELKKLFTGTGIQHFTGTSLARLIVPIPPDDVVELAVEKIETLSCEVQRLTSVYQQKLTALDELKQSLLSRAFAGGL